MHKRASILIILIVCGLSTSGSTASEPSDRATEADTLGESLMKRLLQSNFDTALDARYAIAKGMLWSAFVHPLPQLTPDQFASGLGQVVNLAMTFGSTFTSGGLTFGGGDSGALIEELRKRLTSI